jgi:hypothetical protein
MLMTRRIIIDREGADRAIQTAAAALEDLVQFCDQGEEFAVATLLQRVRQFLLSDMEASIAEKTDLLDAVADLHVTRDIEIPDQPF